MAYTYDLGSFVHAVRSILKTHELDRPGAYRRWNWPKSGDNRDLGLNPYGCADAANILYTIGHFPDDPAERGAWMDVLQGLQDPTDGLFREATHHPIHTTAHCVAALELFDARPRHALAALAQYRDPAVMEQFLNQLDWRDNPWTASHQGAGLYAALVLAGEVTGEWQARYFTWLHANTDPDTGFSAPDVWRRWATSIRCSRIWPAHSIICSITNTRISPCVSLPALSTPVWTSGPAIRSRSATR
jgi:hypothetical protein